MERHWNGSTLSEYLTLFSLAAASTSGLERHLPIDDLGPLSIFLEHSRLHVVEVAHGTHSHRASWVAVCEAHRAFESVRAGRLCDAKLPFVVFLGAVVTDEIWIVSCSHLGSAVHVDVIVVVFRWGLLRL